MSLDELMDLASEPKARPASDTATVPIRPPRPTTPTTTAAPGPLNPAGPRPTPLAAEVTRRPAPAPAPAATSKPAKAGPDIRERVLADAHRAYEAGMARSRVWLKKGDNTLIVATAGIALLLLVIIAAL